MLKVNVEGPIKLLHIQTIVVLDVELSRNPLETHTHSSPDGNTKCDHIVHHDYGSLRYIYPEKVKERHKAQKLLLSKTHNRKSMKYQNEYFNFISKRGKKRILKYSLSSVRSIISNKLI